MIFAPGTANAEIQESEKPESIRAQFVPLLMERNTPSLVPAKMSEPETARALIQELDNPESTCIQFVPSLIERNTPSN